jgi:two-component system response regulator DesR
MVATGGSVFEEEPEEERNRPALSEREQQVLALVAAGATNREIATELHLSPYTVKEYASGLYRKLDVRNRVEAVLRAEKLGLIA